MEKETIIFNNIKKEISIPSDFNDLKKKISDAFEINDETLNNIEIKTNDGDVVTNEEDFENLIDSNYPKLILKATNNINDNKLEILIKNLNDKIDTNNKNIQNLKKNVNILFQNIYSEIKKISNNNNNNHFDLNISEILKENNNNLITKLKNENKKTDEINYLTNQLNNLKNVLNEKFNNLSDNLSQINLNDNFNENDQFNQKINLIEKKLIQQEIKLEKKFNEQKNFYEEKLKEQKSLFEKMNSQQNELKQILINIQKNQEEEKLRQKQKEEEEEEKLKQKQKEKEEEDRLRQKQKEKEEKKNKVKFLTNEMPLNLELKSDEIKNGYFMKIRLKNEGNMKFNKKYHLDLNKPNKLIKINNNYLPKIVEPQEIIEIEIKLIFISIESLENSFSLCFELVDDKNKNVSGSSLECNFNIKRDEEDDNDNSLNDIEKEKKENKSESEDNDNDNGGGDKMKKIKKITDYMNEEEIEIFYSKLNNDYNIEANGKDINFIIIKINEILQNENIQFKNKEEFKEIIEEKLLDFVF